MGMMGRYVDALPDRAKDRIIEAQEWCVCDVVSESRARCLIGHAEDWHRLDQPAAWWRRALLRASHGDESEDAADAEQGLAFAYTAEFFAFRRARPADLAVYRARVRRWGLASESRIGSRFDRLCGRRGVATAARLVKLRAARSAPSAAPSLPGASRRADAGVRRA